MLYLVYQKDCHNENTCEEDFRHIISNVQSFDIITVIYFSVSIYYSMRGNWVWHDVWKRECFFGFRMGQVLLLKTSLEEYIGENSVRGFLISHNGRGRGGRRAAGRLCRSLPLSSLLWEQGLKTLASIASKRTEPRKGKRKNTFPWSTWLGKFFCAFLKAVLPF